MSKPTKVAGGWEWGGHVWQGRNAREKAFASWNEGGSPKEDAVAKAKETKEAKAKEKLDKLKAKDEVVEEPAPGEGE